MHHYGVIGSRTVLNEELVSPLRNIIHILRRCANHLEDARHLVILRVTREYWITYIQLCHDATEAPHINGRSVGNAQHDLRCSVKPGLDIGVDSFIQEGGTSKVNYFDS